MINWTPLKDENSRTYHFANGEEISFDNVVKIEIRESGKHRIECADGTKAFICPGWLWLEIDAEEWSA